MKSPAATIGSSSFGFRVKPIRIAEFSLLAFLAVAMGLPLLFLITGSFNQLLPENRLCMVSAIGSPPSPIRER